MGEDGMRWIGRDRQGHVGMGNPWQFFVHGVLGFFPQGEMASSVPFIKNTLAAVLRINERGATLVQGDSIMHAMFISLSSCTVSHLSFKLPPLEHSLPTCRLSCFFFLRAFCIYHSCTVYYLYRSDFIPCLFSPIDWEWLDGRNHFFYVIGNYKLIQCAFVEWVNKWLHWSGGLSLT